MTKAQIVFVSLLYTSSAVHCFHHYVKRPVAHRTAVNAIERPTFDPLGLCDAEDSTRFRREDAPRDGRRAALIGLAASLPALATPELASAATANAPNAIGSALVGYGHYLAMIGVTGCLFAERLTIKPNMDSESEDLIAVADIMYGLFGALIAYTGYLRTVQYEKGFYFYSHEPLFWLKIAMVGVFGATSFFNTTTIIQRSIAKRTGKLEPMGEKLSKRMISICNAELTALASIPLVATFMARGVSYSESIPWQVEAGAAAILFAGLSFKYIKEALTFEDGPLVPVQEADSEPIP